MSGGHEEELSRALGVLAAEMAGWGPESLDCLVEAFTVGTVVEAAATALAGAARTPLVMAVERLVRHQHLEPDGESEDAFDFVGRLEAGERAALLERADGFIVPSFAWLLADRLEEVGLLPDYSRLPALLATTDAERCDRLLRRLGTATGRADERWIEAVVEAVLAATDAGLEVPEVAAAAWAEIENADPYDLDPEAWYAASLRVAARRDPVAALELLVEAVDEVGDVELAEGMTSVVVRASAVDSAAVWRFLLEETVSLSHRTLVLRDLCWWGDFGAREREFCERLVAELPEPHDPGDREPRAIWVTTLALLGLSASVGDADLAVQVVERAGPPRWGAFAATWPEGRRRSLRAGWDPAFWPLVDEAISTTGSGVASGDWMSVPAMAGWPREALAALWTVRTAPLEVLPWWRAWGREVP